MTWVRITLTLNTERKREIQTSPLGLYQRYDIMSFLNVFLANIAIQISVYTSSESLSPSLGIKRQRNANIDGVFGEHSRS